MGIIRSTQVTQNGNKSCKVNIEVEMEKSLTSVNSLQLTYASISK